MTTVYLGFGSNLGESAAIIEAAYAELAHILSKPRISRFWLTHALYMEDQPDFINAVASGETEMSPRELLIEANRIEAHFGRDRGRESRKGPRPLDIDILLYGNCLVVERDLVIPHPGLREHKFALLPLLELAPDLKDPLSGIRLATVAASLPPQGIYLLESDRYDRLYQ
jgi:2-amino-4-hydroxy-6-hydroxymethyldihydropteridine diphosphokinase